MSQKKLYTGKIFNFEISGRKYAFVESSVRIKNISETEVKLRKLRLVYFIIKIKELIPEKTSSTLSRLR